jgi:hypothetical protein
MCSIPCKNHESPAPTYQSIAQAPAHPTPARDCTECGRTCADHPHRTSPCEPTTVVTTTQTTTQHHQHSEEPANGANSGPENKIVRLWRSTGLPASVITQALGCHQVTAVLPQRSALCCTRTPPGERRMPTSRGPIPDSPASANRSIFSVAPSTTVAARSHQRRTTPGRVQAVKRQVVSRRNRTQRDQTSRLRRISRPTTAGQPT